MATSWSCSSSTLLSPFRLFTRHPLDQKVNEMMPADARATQPACAQLGRLFQNAQHRKASVTAIAAITARITHAEMLIPKRARISDAITAQAGGPPRPRI